MDKQPRAELGAAHAIRALENGDAKTVARFLQETVLDKHLACAPRRVQVFVDILVRKLNPDCAGEVFKLVFRRRPGNQPDATDLAIRNSEIVGACDACYRQCLEAGEPRRGLPKKVAREVGKSFHLGGDAVEDIWQRAKRERKARSAHNYDNALAKGRSRNMFD